MLTSADVSPPPIPDFPPLVELLHAPPTFTRDPDPCSDNMVDLVPLHEGRLQSVLAVPSIARAAEIYGQESIGKTDMEEEEDSLDKEWGRESSCDKESSSNEYEVQQ